MWGRWVPSSAAFGDWRWGPPKADEATIEALSPSPPRCYQAIAEGSVCCATGAAWVCGGGAAACTLAGDVDGDCATADLDEAMVRDELEAVLRLAQLQGLLLEAQAPAALARDTETCSGGACAVGTDDTVTLPQSAAPAPTVEGRIEWDADDNRIAVGNGAGGTVVFHSGAHTVDTDTTCLDAGVSCPFAGAASEGGAAVDVSCTECIAAAEIASDAITEAKLKTVNALTDEYCLTAETTTGDFEWQPCFSLTVKEADGTPSVAGVSTIQLSGCTLTDNGGGDVTLTCTGAAPAGSGSELQFRSSGSAFGAVTSSSVSGANVTLGGTLGGITQLNVDNLRFDGNTLSSTDTNGNVTVDPNGTGTIIPLGHLTPTDNTYDIGQLSATRFRNLYLSGNIDQVSNISGASGDMWIRTGTDVRFGSGITLMWTSGAANAGGDVILSRASGGVLKLDDALRPDPVSGPPVTCGSANTAGVIYYDSDSNEACLCDGTSWTGLKAGGACS